MIRAAPKIGDADFKDALVGYGRSLIFASYLFIEEVLSYAGRFREQVLLPCTNLEIQKKSF